MQGKVEICGVNTAKLKTLRNDEMMELIRRAQAGRRRNARTRLVEGNLKLVLSVIQRFMGRGENPDDLFQVGCIGLLKAIANFDTTKDVRFSTYGVPMIAGELRRYLRDYSPIRISRSTRDTAYKVLQCKEALTAQNGREPTNGEIASSLGLPLEEVVNALDAITAPVSLYEPVYSDGGDPLMVMDQVRDPKNTDEQLAREHRAAAGHPRAGRPGKAHSGAAVLRRENADGGGQSGRHLAGTGVAAREKRDPRHPQGHLHVITGLAQAYPAKEAYAGGCRNAQPVFRAAQQGDHSRLRGVQAGVYERSDDRAGDGPQW